MRFHRLKILIGSQIDDDIVALSLQRLIQLLGNGLAPELVQIFAARVFQTDPHLQAVGLHQVQRAQHAIQAGEHAQVSLGEVKVVLGERLCLQAGVDIALKGKDRLAGILRRKVRMPVVETGGVQIRQLVANAH